MESVSTRVYRNFVYHITDEDINIDNALDVVKALVYIVDGFGKLSGEQKKRIVIQTLEDISAGPDGVLGTPDDIIPPHVLEAAKALIECNLISDTIDLICEATNAKAGCRVTLWVYRVFTYMLCCKCWPKNKIDPLLS